ncbi:MAG TPA: hypothetical protein VIQ51_02510 [Chryseosolibacter sp.]
MVSTPLVEYNTTAFRPERTAIANLMVARHGALRNPGPHERSILPEDRIESSHSQNFVRRAPGALLVG